MSRAPALAGARVLVTRTREAAEGLVDALQAAGVEVVVVPLITTVPLAPPAAVQDALAALERGPAPRWLVLSSATAARLLTGAASSPSDAVSIAAVGDATAAALRAAGWPVSTVPGTQAGRGVAEALEAGIAGGTALLPAAEAAHSELPDRLAAAGANVTRLALYRSDMPEDAPRRLASAMKRRLDAVLLTSGSTARHLVRALRGRPLDPATRVVAMGQQTGADAAAAGLRVDAVAETPSVQGLVDALQRVLTGHQPVR